MMKHILLTTIAAVLVVGCGPSMSIHDAARDGNIEVVKQHIAAKLGADVNAKDKLGRTPLHQAARKGRKEITELLIAEGADVNAKHEEGWTPLHLAAVYGNKEIVELLIAKGADVNAKDEDGRTPLDWAIGGNHKETADLLRKHGGKTAKPSISIHDAALDGNIEAVKEHLAAGADVNAKNRSGWTPLHQAAWRGRNEIVELLIAEGADVNAKIDDGRTPLDLAIQYKHPKTADLLRKHGGKTGEELKAEGK